MRYALLFSLFFVTHALVAQEQFGLNRPSIKWYQIKTKTGKIIYPAGCDSIAYRSAGVMDYQYDHDTTIIGAGNTNKVPVIIQNQSTLPAGFSTPAPWRSEYYITPPQNLFLGPVNWMDGLTAHEYRHTQQFAAGHDGFNLVYQVLMGQTGWLFNALMTQPLWFREGDAVTYETLLTRGGRGRLPAFHMEYRAMRLSGYRFNYEKAHFNSFKHYVPNAYRLGYYMVTKARRDYGQTIWQEVLFDAYHRKGFFYSFSRSLKKYTGEGTVGLYKATVVELDSIFSKTDNNIQPTTSTSCVRHDERVYTNYRFPHWVSDSAVLVLKSGFNEIPTYYFLHADGKQQRLFVAGQYTEDHQTSVVEGDWMTWAESGFHERWINEDYSVVQCYNFRTKKHKQLTFKSRYFSPAPSHAGKEVSVVYIDKSNRCEIHVLDLRSGKVLRKFSLAEGTLAAQPRWTPNDEQLVMILQHQAGNTIVLMNSQNGTIVELLPFTDVPLSRPFPHGDYVYYSAGEGAVNNIYAVKISDGTVYQITNVRFGAFEPVVSVDGQRLLFSEYTAEGYKTKVQTLTPQSYLPIEGSRTDIKFHESLQAFDGKDLTTAVFSSTYTPKRYHAMTSGLFKVYGWIPLPNVPEYGVELYTQNIMSTVRGTLGVLYNTNESNVHTYARVSYAALYPWIEMEVDYGLNRKSKNINANSKEVRSIAWTDHLVSLGARVPFRLTQGVYTSKLSVGAYAQYYDVSGLDTTGGLEVTSNDNFYAGKAEFIFSRLRIQARQHVRPRWGQTFTLLYQEAINDKPFRLAAVGLLYFPGIHKTHSLNFSLSYKKEQVTDVYRFKDNFIMPRGYLTTPLDEIYGVACNYEFPIWYPDLSAGPVAQFQRLRWNMFFDYAQTSSLLNSSAPMSSVGSELYVDFRFFRLFQMTVGFRYNYVLEQGPFPVTPFQVVIPRFELVN